MVFQNKGYPSVEKVIGLRITKNTPEDQNEPLQKVTYKV